MQLTTRTSRLPIVVACLIGTILSMTPVILMTFGEFLIPISRDFHRSRATVSGVLLLLCLVTAAGYLIAGRLSDRFGPRRVIVPGALLLALAVAALSLSDGSMVLFYLTFAMIGLFGALPSTMMFSRIISDWFDARRGLMLGLTAGLGNGAGASLMPFVAMFLIRSYGWRDAYLGLGLCVGLVSFPALFLLLRDRIAIRSDTRSADGSQSGLTLSEAARQPVFWIIMSAVALGAGCMTAIISHIVPLLSGRGIRLTLSVSIMSVMAATCAVWQVAMGWLMDRSRSPRIMAPFYLAALVSLPLLQCNTAPLLVAGGVCIGIGMGTEYGALPYIISRYFGLRSYGAIAGVMYAVVLVAQGLTPMLMDMVFDRTGSYNLSIYAMAMALVIGTILIGFLKPFASSGSAVQAAPGKTHLSPA